MVAGLRHIAEQGISGCVYVIGDGLPGDGYVFDTTRGPGSLGEIDGLALPEYIVLPFLDTFDPGLELFVIADGNGTGECRVILNIRKMVFTAEFRRLPLFDQIPKDLLLILQRRGHPLSNLLVDIAGEWTGQEGFYLHESGRVEQQIYQGKKRNKEGQNFFSWLSL
jgi:hypothetical protein